MARTTITVITAPGSYASGGASITWTAADVTNKNQWRPTGNDIVIARNTDAAAAHNVTITSAPDPYGRKGDISQSIPASGYMVFGPFKSMGWEQTDGYIYLEADDAQVEFVVIGLG